MFNKKFILEKIIYLIVLLGVVFGFLYFEENLWLKILAVFLVVIGLLLTLKHQENAPNSRFELLNLTLLYLGFFSIYNLLHGINLPIYAAMLIFLIFIFILFGSTLIIDEIDKLLGRNLFLSFVLTTGLVLTELFLSLYFWPIDPGLKSLILVVSYYQISSLVYLYSRSVLRLGKIGGHLLINLLILAAIFLTVWLGLPK